MRAVILAAGEGTRLRPYTDDRPKCLVEFAGQALLEWQLRALRDSGLDDVTVVTGYRAEMIDALGVATRHNAEYATTNMVASLMSARDRFDGTDDVLIAYGDIVYESRLIRAMERPSGPVSVAIDTEWRRLWELRMVDPLADAETLRVNSDGCIVELGRVPASYDDIEGQYIGLIAISASFAARLVETYDALDPAGPYEGRDRNGMYMTAFLQLLIDSGTPVRAVPVSGGWIEVDTTDDLMVYEALRASGQLDAVISLGEDESR